MAGPRFIASSRYRAAIFHYWYIAEPRPRQSTGCSSIRDAISGDTTRCSFFSLSNINHESFQGCAQPGILPESPSIRQNRVNRDRFFFSLYPRREICPNGSCLPPLLILFYRWSWILKFIRVKRRVIGYGTSVSLGIGRSSNLKNIFQLEKLDYVIDEILGCIFRIDLSIEDLLSRIIIGKIRRMRRVVSKICYKLGSFFNVEFDRDYEGVYRVWKDGRLWCVHCCPIRRGIGWEEAHCASLVPWNASFVPDSALLSR